MVDNFSMRARMVLLVLGSLMFIAGAMGPIAVSAATKKNEEFRQKLEKIGGGTMRVYRRQMQATEEASANMGIAATALLLLTLGCALYAARGIVRRLTGLTESAERMRGGDLDTAVSVEAETEFDALALALDRMRLDLKQVVALSVQRTDLEKDLAVASTVQSFFLPKQSRLVTANASLHAYYQPAANCGGDWWWVHEQPDGSLLILIGDVTGHGTGPAMITASLASAFHMLLQQGGGSDPAKLIGDVNEVLREICKEQFFVTLGALTVHPKSGLVRLLNAGAPPILTVSPEGNVEALTASGDRLGEATLKLGVAEAVLAPGSRILAFTDGVPELTQADGKTLGLRRLRKLLREISSDDADRAHARLAAVIETALGGAAPEDDVTYVLVEVGTPGSGSAA